MIQRTFLRSTRLAGTVAKQQLRLPASRSQTIFRPAVLPRSFHHCSGLRSQETEQKTDAGSDSAANSGDKAVDTLKKEVEAKNKEILDFKDKYLRSVADFRNLQERTKREVQSAKDFAIQKFAKDLMESVDNLDRALAMVTPEKLAASKSSEDARDLVNLYDGLKMTEQILMSTLSKHGLERFDPSIASEKFDPNQHEATFMTPMADKEDGTVFHTQVKGFKLNNRVIRAAKVGVVKN